MRSSRLVAYSHEALIWLVAYSHEALIWRKREGKERKSIVWWRGIGMVERKKGIHFLRCPIIFFSFYFFFIIIGGEGIQTLVLLVRGTDHCHLAIKLLVFLLSLRRKGVNKNRLFSLILLPPSKLTEHRNLFIIKKIKKISPFSSLLLLHFTRYSVMS